MISIATLVDDQPCGTTMHPIPRHSDRIPGINLVLAGSANCLSVGLALARFALARLAVVGLVLAGLVVTGCQDRDAGRVAIGESNLRATDPGGDGAAVPIDIQLPLSTADWQALEHQRVRFLNPMIVVDTYNLARFGQVTLAAGQRLYVPTNAIDPNDLNADGTTTAGAGNADQVRAAHSHNQSMSVILDDGQSTQNPRPVPFLQRANGTLQSLRVGSSIDELTGVILKIKGRYHVVPDGPLAITNADRPDRPQLGDANVVVASCNVLNYWTTIDDGTNGARGADNQGEYHRQRAKLTAGLIDIDADVLGLIELENNQDAETDLVAAMNADAGEQRYAGLGVPPEFESAPGGDNAIRVGLIYRRDRIQPVGPIGIVDDPAFANARTPLVQRFRRIDGEESITIVVNHFKSKGTSNATGPDRDQNDGQSGYNDSRRRQSAAIVQFTQALIANDPDAEVLVVGDLNAYCQEDPIDMLRRGGLIDLVGESVGPTQPYSFIYYGQSGLLDHAFATPSLAGRVTAAKVWHVNCDEPRCFDYNTEFNPGDAYQPDRFRYADHDPLLIGLHLD